DVILGANLPFDLGCLAEHGHVPIGELFARLSAGGARDVQARARLLDIAAGTHTPHVKYNLGALATRYGLAADKANPWRLRFAELERVPVTEWPAEALEYALADVSVPLAIYHAQERAAERMSAELGGPVLADESARIRA